MADAVTSQILMDGERKAVMKFTNISDATGETLVTKVDVSALAPNSFGLACDKVSIERIQCSIGGMTVVLYWDATADVVAFTLVEGTEDFDFSTLELANNAGAGVTGDILFSTLGAVANSTYSIVLHMVKSYASA